jgi:hypothetical protein
MMTSKSVSFYQFGTTRKCLRQKLVHPINERVIQVTPFSPGSQQTSPERVRYLCGVFDVTQRKSASNAAQRHPYHRITTGVYELFAVRLRSSSSRTNHRRSLTNPKENPAFSLLITSALAEMITVSSEAQTRRSMPLHQSMQNALELAAALGADVTPAGDCFAGSSSPYASSLQVM